MFCFFCVRTLSLSLSRFALMLLRFGNVAMFAATMLVAVLLLALSPGALAGVGNCADAMCVFNAVNCTTPEQCSYVVVVVRCRSLSFVVATRSLRRASRAPAATQRFLRTQTVALAS